MENRGHTYDPALDADRLNKQLGRVYELMKDGQWRSLGEIKAVGGSEASISARLRDLRKKEFGSYRVEHKRLGGGLWVYRVLPPLEPGQMTFDLIEK